jgi:hypothetical protein
MIGVPLKVIGIGKKHYTALVAIHWKLYTKIWHGGMVQSHHIPHEIPYLNFEPNWRTGF